MGRTAWLPMPCSGCPLSKLQCLAREERTANCEGLHHRIRMVRLAELGGRRAARRSRLLVLVFQQPDVSWPILYLKVVPIKASVAPFDSLFVTVTKNRLGDVVHSSPGSDHCLRRVWREADHEATDYEIAVMDLLEGQYKYPIGILPVEGWSRDEDIAQNFEDAAICSCANFPHPFKIS
jgi:hypothetical protein